jgi:hypothetical protein
MSSNYKQEKHILSTIQASFINHHQHFHLNHPSSCLHGKTLQLIMCFLLIIVAAASGTPTTTVVLGDDGSANAWTEASDCRHRQKKPREFVHP